MSENRSVTSSTDPAILLIEDDDDIASLLKLHLSDSGYQVTHEATGPSGLERALGGTWQLIILDLMLPGLDGMEICRRIRSDNPEVPILMLTARGEEIDKILGFEVGADDYLTKPFSIRELLARVAALLQRGYEHIYLDGGITVQHFLRAGLVDRLILTIVPVLIGSGKPLFGSLTEDIPLRLVDQTTWPSGLVQLTYELQKCNKYVFIYIFIVIFYTFRDSSRIECSPPDSPVMLPMPGFGR